MTADESVPTAGAQLGRYVAIREVAQGALGPLYIAERQVEAGVLYGLARVVPLPAGLPPHDEQILADAIWDSTHLTHELVLRVADVVTGKGWLALVHEHSEGSLIEFLQSCSAELGSPFPAKVASRIALDVIEGLEQSRDHCMTAKIPWRPGSVTPGSLLLGPDGRVRALDGQVCAAALRISAMRAQPGLTAFAAPEVFDDSKEPTERCDVFSIGVLLWELLTGKKLFEGRSAQSLAQGIRAPKIAQNLPPGVEVPQGLIHTVHTALEAEPTRRQASLRELAVAIVMGVEEVATYDQVIAFTDSLLVDPSAQDDAEPTVLVTALQPGTLPFDLPTQESPEGVAPVEIAPAAPSAAEPAPPEEAPVATAQEPSPAPTFVPLLARPPSQPPPAAEIDAPPSASPEPERAPQQEAAAAPTVDAVAERAAPPIAAVEAEAPSVEVSKVAEPAVEAAPKPTPEVAAVAKPAPEASAVEPALPKIRDKLSTLPGQGSPHPDEVEMRPSAPAPTAQLPPLMPVTAASTTRTPAASPSNPVGSNRVQPVSPRPVEPFRLVTEEPFVPLPVQPVQAIDARAKVTSDPPKSSPRSVSDRPADIAMSASEAPAAPRKTLQLSLGTLIFGFLTTVLAVVVIMLVFQRSQGTSPAQAQVAPADSAALGNANSVRTQVSAAEPASANTVEHSDAGLSNPLHPKVEIRKKAAKDQPKSAKSSAPESEPSSNDTKGPTPGKHYVPSEL